MIFNIIKSLAITTVVAIIFSILFNYTAGYDYMKTFVVAFLLQIVGFYIWNSLLQVVLTIRVEKERTIQADMLSRQGIGVACAYCNDANYIPVRMDDDNNFTCEACDKENSVYIDITVAQKTDIIDKQSVSVNSYIKDKVDATQRIQQGE